MKDYSSVFPDNVDKLNFFQDISIDKIPIMEKHQRMIAQKTYSAASEYLNEQDITFYGAWVLNMFEERLIAIENYILYQLEKPNLTTYKDIEPTNVDVGYCWT